MTSDLFDDARAPAPAGSRTPAGLAALVETAQTYARAAVSQNALRADAADWRDYRAGG